MATEGGNKVSIHDCINTMRALLTMSERVRDKNPEPVTYDGKAVQGYITMYVAGDMLAVVSQNVFMEQACVYFASLLHQVRKGMTDHAFRVLVKPLATELAEECMAYMEKHPSPYIDELAKRVADGRMPVDPPAL